MSFRVSLVKTILNINYVPRRNCSERFEGIQYPGFTYYPRDKNFQDPPYEPSKLLFVKRIKSMKGRNPSERKSLEHLNIDGEVRHNGHISVVKNIPTVNSLLWSVKHLVEIKPIIINGELPKDGDYSGSFLRQTGEFIVSPKLKVTAEQVEVSQNCWSKKFKNSYIKEYLRRKWENAYNSYE